MVCDKCGTEVTKNDKFCPKCGAEVIKRKKKKKEIPEVEEYKLKDKEIEKLAQSFASRDEKYIASLGNGYIMNYLTNKSLKKGIAFLTDKRVYFKGSCLSGKGKSLVKTDEERTVDVKNITGSGFIYQRYWGILIALVIALIVSLAGTIASGFLTNYAKERVVSLAWEKKAINVLETALNEWDDITWNTYYENTFGTFEHQYGKCIIYYVEPYSWNENEVVVRNTDSTVAPTSIPSDTYRDASIEICIYTNYESLALSAVTRELEVLRDERNRGSQIILNSLATVVPIGLCLSLIVICCIGIKNYLLKRRTLFRIEYAGGCIAFDVSFYAKAEIDDFQKQLRRIKDFSEETTTIKTVAVETPIQSPTQSSVPDDLRKYAELLKEGLISQEEYDAMKKKILGL